MLNGYKEAIKEINEYWDNVTPKTTAEYLAEVDAYIAEINSK